MPGGTRRCVVAAAALAADLAVGQPPLDPRPLDAVPALAELAVADLPPDLPPWADDVAAGLVGGLLGVVVRSPALATYLSAGASHLAIEAQKLADALVLGDAATAAAVSSGLRHRCGAPPEPELGAMVVPGIDARPAPVGGVEEAGGDGANVGDDPLDPDAALDLLATAFAATVVGPAVGSAFGGAPGALAAVARISRRGGRGPGAGDAGVAVLSFATARPSVAGVVVRSAADALTNGRAPTAPAVGLRAALGVGDLAEPGDVVAAARLLRDAGAALVVLLLAGAVVAAGASAVARVTVRRRRPA